MNMYRSMMKVNLYKISYGELRQRLGADTDTICDFKFTVIPTLVSNVAVMLAGAEYRQDAGEFKTVMSQTKEAMQELEALIEQISGAASGINSMMAQSSAGINDIAEKSGKTQEITAEGCERLKECRQSIEELRKIVEQFHLE